MIATPAPRAIPPAKDPPSKPPFFGFGVGVGAAVDVCVLYVFVLYGLVVIGIIVAGEPVMPVSLEMGSTVPENKIWK